MTAALTDIFGRAPLALLAFAFASVVTQAHGQTVERNPAMALQGQQSELLNAAAFAASPADPAPFGVDLAGLLIVDAHSNGGNILQHPGGGGVNTTFGGPTAQNDALSKRLAGFIGKPLSFKLLSEIQTQITEFSRENGRSLVSVTVPQQEITGGNVQINVTAFVLATKQVQGADPLATAYVQRNIRLKPGQEVDTDQLLADVNWLNQNPFRHVAVQFQPGDAPDSTILTLKVQSARTWSGFAGVSNSGTEATGEIRLYGGFNMSALPWKDQQLSYQTTAAPESLQSGRLWDAGTTKGYLSHAVGYLIPITTDSGFRTKLTFGASHISSYSDGVIATKAETTVLDAEMAVPLAKINGRFALVPELYAKLEYDDYNSLGYFAGLPILPEEVTRLAQVTLGVRSAISGEVFGKSSRGSLDMGLVFGRRDTDETKSNYSYARFKLNHEVFVTQTSSLAVRVTGQSSGDDLHPLSQLALGGDSTVRGYDVNGVSGSTALAASIEYRASPISFGAGGQEAKFHPHVFVDYGFARQAGPTDQFMRAVGLGGQFEVGDNVVGTLDLAHAFTDAGSTDADETNVAFQMTVRF